MGSGNSKTRRIDGSVSSCASSTSSSSKNRRKSRALFSSSCLGSSSGAYHSDDDDDDDFQVSDHRNESSVARIDQTESESGEVKAEGYQTVKVDVPDNIPCISSNAVLGEWTRASETGNVIRADGSSSQAFSSRSNNNSNRLLSRFSFVPGSVSFRLNRASSVGSSRAYPPSPTSFAASSGEDHLYRSWPLGLSENVNSSSRTSSSRRANSGDSSVNLSLNHFTSALSHSLGENQVISAPDLVGNDSERNADACLLSVGDSLNRRVNDHQNGAREPVDRNVRFSRTLSVGRLRDRVLRRSSFSDLTLSPLQQGLTAVSDENAVNSLMSSPYPMPNRFYSSQGNGVETSSLRDGRRNDLLENRSNFLERRRRIRSQVRALQRLGSRFENLSGHERNCVLSGQHRTGRCSCGTNTRESNSTDDGSARASISRIVMLAEALFEVLDEIHQQSVVLSSRPSLSSIGSVPAPSEVVDSLPLRVFAKSSKLQAEEASQCYICLVEYEEGDGVRVLPCHHEFHKKCIDKWLKEIHRVCPLCRGDICRSDSLPTES